MPYIMRYPAIFNRPVSVLNYCLIAALYGWE